MNTYLVLVEKPTGPRAKTTTLVVVVTDSAETAHERALVLVGGGVRRESDKVLRTDLVAQDTAVRVRG